MSIQETLAAYLDENHRRLYARLVRVLGDFDLAEDALQDAVSAALLQWPFEGVPNNPGAWLYRVAHFKGIDVLRKRGRLHLGGEAEIDQVPDSEDRFDLEEIGDEVLRLVFTCCHPAIAPESQIALTLREVCGLTTEEIARAFLIPAPTVAQRIVRAKNKIREAKIPFEVPSGDEKVGRLRAVLRTIYLVFNEGHSASSGEEAIRTDLVEEAVRLGRLLADLLPEPETWGLLALMLLNRSRMPSRTSAEGEIVLLNHQDRSLWNQVQIAEGLALVHRALRAGPAGSYALQAAISAVHCAAPTYESTDWGEIVGLYSALLRLEPSPVVQLNRAVAVAMRDGPASGVCLIDRLFAEGALTDYHPAYAARAALLCEAGRAGEAAEDYRRALELATNAPERKFLLDRLEEVEAGPQPQKL